MGWGGLGGPRTSKGKHAPILLSHLDKPGPAAKVSISIDSQLRENTIEIFIDRIKRAADVGIKNMVIHPSGEPNDDRDRPELMKSAKYCLDKLAEVAHKEGATICVEDMPRTCLGNCSDDILDLISANDKLR